MIDIEFQEDGAPRMFSRLFEAAAPKLAARLGIADYKVRLTARLIEAPVALVEGFGYGMITPDTKIEAPRLAQGLSPRAFRMVICYGQPPSELMETICHEFVHLKQWVTGELRAWVDGGGDKKLAYLGNLDVGSIPYKDQPWEKEALRLQKPLADWLTDALLEDLDKEEKSFAT